MLFRYLCLFIAYIGGGFLIGFYMAPGLAAVALTIGWCVGVYFAFHYGWPLPQPNWDVEETDLSHLTRQAGLPPGYAIIAVNSFADRRNERLMLISLVIVNTRYPMRPILAEGATLEAAMADARAKVARVSG